MTYYQVPKRSQIKIGAKVKIAEKKNYENGRITTGIVKEILTAKEDHPRGVKVKLNNGIVGRVQALGDEDLKPIVTESEQIKSSELFDYQPSEDELI